MKKVVVVEDESLVREIVVCELEDSGYAVVEFASADAALIYLVEHLGDASLILTDVQMPGTLNGLQLADIVSRTWPAIPILVTSGGSLVNPDALPNSARFLRKPWLPADVVERIDGMVSSQLN